MNIKRFLKGVARGFSLMELIIVMAMMGSITLIAVPSISGVQNRSQINADKLTGSQIGTAFLIRKYDSTGNTSIGATTDYREITGIEAYVSSSYKPASMKNSYYVVSEAIVDGKAVLMVGITNKDVNEVIELEEYDGINPGWVWCEKGKISDFLTKNKDSIEIGKKVEVEQTYYINASCSIGGTISPRGLTAVTEGDDKPYLATPNNGYKFKEFIIDDSTSYSTKNYYTFYNVLGEHSIVACFEECTHNWQVAASSLATCSSNGVTSYVCSDCGTTKTEVTSYATGHNYEVSNQEISGSTITTTYQCENCGIQREDDQTIDSYECECTDCSKKVDNVGEYCSDCTGTICVVCEACSDCVGGMCYECGGICISCCDIEHYDCACSNCSISVSSNGDFCGPCSSTTCSECGACSVCAGDMCTICGECDGCCPNNHIKCPCCETWDCTRCAEDNLCSECGSCSVCVGELCWICGECNGCCSNNHIECPCCGTWDCTRCAEDNLCSECGLCSVCVGELCWICGECDGCCPNHTQCPCCQAYDCEVCGGNNWCSTCEKCERCCTGHLCIICGRTDGGHNYCPNCGDHGCRGECIPTSCDICGTDLCTDCGGCLGDCWTCSCGYYCYICGANNPNQHTRCGNCGVHGCGGECRNCSDCGNYPCSCYCDICGAYYLDGCTDCGLCGEHGCGGVCRCQDCGRYPCICDDSSCDICGTDLCTDCGGCLGDCWTCSCGYYCSVCGTTDPSEHEYCVYCDRHGCKETCDETNACPDCGNYPCTCEEDNRCIDCGSDPCECDFGGSY